MGSPPCRLGSQTWVHLLHSLAKQAEQDYKVAIKLNRSNLKGYPYARIIFYFWCLKCPEGRVVSYSLDKINTWQP